MHTQIGVSAFRVDLGVVHPDSPGIYLAGIECDGATYHRSATARDRDKLREKVLRDLGWEILRVWSVGWWIDREGTLEQLDSRLGSLLAASRANQQQAAQEDEMPDERLESGAIEPEPAAEAARLVAVAAAAGGYAGAAPPPAEIDAVPAPEAEPEHFFERSYDETLAGMIAAVIEKEGRPVLDEVLSRRIARAHGFQRTGARISERVTRLAARRFRKTKEDVGTFFWPAALEQGQPFRFRAALERGVDEICMRELVSLASELLAQGVAAEDVIVGMARELGVRLRDSTRRRLQTAVRRAASGAAQTAARVRPAED